MSITNVDHLKQLIAEQKENRVAQQVFKNGVDKTQAIIDTLDLEINVIKPSVIRAQILRLLNQPDAVKIEIIRSILSWADNESVMLVLNELVHEEEVYLYKNTIGEKSYSLLSDLITET